MWRSLAIFAGGVATSLLACAQIIGLEPTRDDPQAVNDAGGDAAAAKVRALVAGTFHTCMLSADGAARCWGQNLAGQIGNGTAINALRATPVIGMNGGVSAISAGPTTSCGLLDTGTLRCWGGNAHGQIGDGTQINRAEPKEVDLPEAANAVGTGGGHTCALTRLETFCWGDNSIGQLGDGTLVSKNAPVAVPGMNGASAITTGAFHTCAIDEAEAYCWGQNNAGQLGDGTKADKTAPTKVVGLVEPRSISAYGLSTCATTAEKVAFCWGLNGNGQVGDGTKDNALVPKRVGVLSGPVAAVSAGANHNCALLESGAVQCWGDNTYGQLGDGTLADRSTAVEVDFGGVPAIAVAAGGHHTCAALSDGRVMCWGENKNGQLGDGTRDDRPLPVAVQEAL